MLLSLGRRVCLRSGNRKSSCKRSRSALFGTRGEGVLAMGRRSLSTQKKSAQGVVYESFGIPEEVLHMKEMSVPNTLSPSQVLLKVLAAPINPADLNLVEGTYGLKVPLPAVGGNEGVAKVLEVGTAVKNLKPEDHVIFIKPGQGTWRTVGVFEEESVLRIPDTLPVQQAATLSVNPCTAFRLLEDFEDLRSGDVLVQNGANSTVGQAVIQLAKRKQVKTINILRGRTDYPEMVERLQAMGGDLVVSEDYIRTPQFKRLLSDLPKPKLALNCVGGNSATEMARVLGDGGTLVTYGGMSRKPVTIPTSLFIFRNIQLKGFWMTRWLEEHSREEVTEMINHLHQLFDEGKLTLWLEHWGFNRFQEALMKAKEPQHSRKVVLTMED